MSAIKRLKTVAMLLTAIGTFSISYGSYAEARVQATDRIVTAGGTVTDIVYALGAGEQVVAVDRSSTYPIAATQKPSVGYYRELSAEGLLSLAPDWLLTIEGAGRDGVLKQIAATGVKIHKFDKPSDVDGLVTLVTAIAEKLDRQAAGKALINRIVASLPAIQTHFQDAKKGLFLLSAGSRGLVAAGQQTVPDLIFQHAGIRNVARAHQAYKSINLEALIVAEPDFIVMPSHVVAEQDIRSLLCEQPHLQAVPAIKACRVLVMDGLLAMGMTTRLSDAIAQVRDFAYAHSAEPNPQEAD